MLTFSADRFSTEAFDPSVMVSLKLRAINPEASSSGTLFEGLDPHSNQSTDLFSG